MHVAGNMEDTFWGVQRIWDRTKDSPIALGHTDKPLSATKAEFTATADEDLGKRLLKLLASRGSLDSYHLSQELEKDHQQVVGVIKSLQSIGEVSFLLRSSCKCSELVPGQSPGKTYDMTGHWVSL